MKSIKDFLENELKDCFSDNEKQVIIGNVIMYNEDRDISNIINKVGAKEFAFLYRKLLIKENFINPNFDVYYFLKVLDYLTNSQIMINDLNKIKDKDLDNLILAINYNIDIGYEELPNIKDYIIKKNIANDYYYQYTHLYDEFNTILGTSKMEVKYFTEHVLTIPNIAYLLLEFKGMEEETYLKVLYHFANEINNLLNMNKMDLSEYLKNNPNIPNYMFNCKNITKNLMAIYAKLYKRDSYSIGELEKMGKIKDGKIIIDGTYDFSIFVHDESFRDYNEMDFTESYDYRAQEHHNYLCTSYINKYNICEYTSRKYNTLRFFQFDDSGLLAFGNSDTFIKNEKWGSKVLIMKNEKNEVKVFKADEKFTLNSMELEILYSMKYAANNYFTNPIDMQLRCMDKTSHAATNEFDFLRTNNNGEDFEKEYQYQLPLSINSDLIKENIQKEYQYLKENIGSLNWKDLYKFIALATEYNEIENFEEIIKEEIGKKGNLEQIVLNDALANYLQSKAKKR